MRDGAAPQVRAAAQRREATAAFPRTYGEVDGPQEDPAVVVSRLIRQASGHVARLLERVQETEAEALVWGMTSEVERQGGEFPGVGTTYSDEDHVRGDEPGAERLGADSGAAGPGAGGDGWPPAGHGHRGAAGTSRRLNARQPQPV
ncbi:hypothetical protein [Streptomyces sp. NPDC094031]|uniref:hypothetical protein n=1 Tax=Streptomyces sp. NPDC094031 TaxID=3155307 RepID=UPI003331B6DA